MYKLIIVDDESISRNGLQQIIDWKALGFIIEDTFEDGEEAIQYLVTHEVDAILTDICMSEVSGIELAEYVEKHCPKTQVVFMSAYKEFEYAQYAVQYNVQEYIVKPFSVEEVVFVFSRIYEQIEKQKKDERIKESYSELIREMKRELFIDLVMGAVTNIDEFLKKVAKIDQEMNVNSEPCSLIRLTVDEGELNEFLNKKWIYGADTFSQALINFLGFEHNILDYYIVDQHKCNLLIFVISNQAMTKVMFEEQLKQEKDKAVEGIKGVLGIPIAITVEGIYKSVINYFEDSDINYEMSKVATETPVNTIDFSKFISQENLLISYLLCNELNSCIGVFEKMLKSIEPLGNNDNHNFLVNLLIKLDTQNILPESYKNKLFNETIDFSQVYELITLEDRIKWGRVLFGQICSENQLGNNSNSSFSHVMIINKAKKYIDENYCMDISLNEVAEIVYLSPVYFSRLFKEIEGTNYIDYIIKARIRKSQSLLCNPSLKIYEISEMVGYKSVRYFYKMYKNYTGETPTQYRKKLKGYIDE